MVLKLLEVLRAFSVAGPRLALTQVIALCGISKASAFRILETLRAEGYLTKDAHGSYRLTYQLLEVAMVVKDRNPLRKAALPHLGQLNREFQETVNLGALEEDHVVYVEVLESPHRLRIVPTEGSRVTLHATALGKAVAAFLPADELMPILGRDRLQRLTPNTITTISALLRDLARTRDRGYAIDNEEETPQCICVAAPVFDAKARVAGAISVSGPSSRMPPARVQQVGAKSMETARTISELLGFQADSFRPGSAGSGGVLTPRLPRGSEPGAISRFAR